MNTLMDLDPYRYQYWDPGSEEPEERVKVKRTIKRPFVTDIGEERKPLECRFGVSGQNIIERRWYHGVGCIVFDGLCVNQEDFSRLNCAQCIKSTFENFIKGCKHPEWYIDPHGTRRCVACKDELGQDEDPDVYEEVDPPEDDDPDEDPDVDEDPGVYN